MNRRSLLKMLPLAPGAVLIPMAPVVDTRLTFRLSDYVLVYLPEPRPCGECGKEQVFYSHGCTPVASSASTYRMERTCPATPDAIPYAIFDRCLAQATDRSAYYTTHPHPEFRWVA